MPYKLDGTYCMLCQAKTHVECGSCGHKKPNDQYTQVEVTWTNGAKMQIGICVGCAMKNAHHNPQNKQVITQLHHDYWDGQGHQHDRGVVIA